MTENILMIVIT